MVNPAPKPSGFLFAKYIDIVRDAHDDLEKLDRLYEMNHFDRKVEVLKDAGHDHKEAIAIAKSSEQSRIRRNNEERVEALMDYEPTKKKLVQTYSEPAEEPDDPNKPVCF